MMHPKNDIRLPSSPDQDQGDEGNPFTIPSSKYCSSERSGAVCFWNWDGENTSALNLSTDHDMCFLRLKCCGRDDDKL